MTIQPSLRFFLLFFFAAGKKILFRTPSKTFVSIPASSQAGRSVPSQPTIFVDYFFVLSSYLGFICDCYFSYLFLYDFTIVLQMIIISIIIFLLINTSILKTITDFGPFETNCSSVNLPNISPVLTDIFRTIVDVKV